jgi:hypothetical protein
MKQRLQVPGSRPLADFLPRQFFELYRNDKKVAPLVRQLSWSHNLIMMGRCKLPEEREYFLRLTIRERWSKRELERQIDSGLFERAVLEAKTLTSVERNSSRRGWSV